MRVCGTCAAGTRLPALVTVADAGSLQREMIGVYFQYGRSDYIPSDS